MSARLLFGLTWALPSALFAQDVNFDDLRKPGPGLSATAVINGIAKEGSDIVSRFNEVDRGRLEERRAAAIARVAPPPAPTPAPSADTGRRPTAAAPPPAAPAPVANLASRFICSFRCTDNRLIVINEGKSGPLTLALLAPDQGKAREIVSAEAKNVCWDQFKLSPKADWFPCRAQ
jgi:hypothetical protein